MSGYVQSNQIVSIIAPGVAGTYNVNPADSGKTILVPALGAAHALTINLPAVQAGLKYRFMANATLASAATITPTIGPPLYTAVNSLCYGSLINLPNAGAIGITSKGGADTVQLTATAVVGDYIDVNCNGTYWYVNGISTVAAGVA